MGSSKTNSRGLEAPFVKKHQRMEAEMTDNQRRVHSARLVARLFRGDIPLPITYWVFGFTIGIVAFQILEKVIEWNYLAILSLPSGVWGLIGFYSVATGYNFFALVAVWRSAGKYQGRAIWAGLARGAVVLATLSLIGNVVVRNLTWGDADRALSEEIRRINSSLPTMINSDIRVDSVRIREKDIYYDYTLVNRLGTDLDVAEFSSAMTASVRANQCANRQIRLLLDKGRRLVFIYHDKVGKPVSQIVVDTSHCL